jgi:hypothetical protein
MKNKNKKAICILSGGMDSTLATYIAKNDGYEIIAVHFNYGQRTEQKELDAFRKICNELNIIKKYEIDIPFFTQIGTSALTDNTIDIPINGIQEGVPVTCGEVNSRGDSGDYLGFQRFISTGDPELTFFEEQSINFEKLWKKFCN